MKITAFKFGLMEINGKPFSSDLVIFPDGTIQDNWWRKSGHTLELEDLKDLLTHKPTLIVAGTGVHDRMVLAPGLENALKEMGVQILAMATDKAVEKFNDLGSGRDATRKISACFHLTC